MSDIDPHDIGPYYADELVRWAELYGHPEGWVKRAQAAHGRAERYWVALEKIAGFDAFQGGPIAPRESPTTEAMRRIAREALNGR